MLPPRYSKVVKLIHQARRTIIKVLVKYNLSKVSSIDILYSKFSKELTCENFY